MSRGPRDPAARLSFGRLVARIYPVAVRSGYARAMREFWSFVGIGLLAGCGASPIAPPTKAAEAQASYQLVLSNGRVVDGTGAPWFRADVGI